MNLESLNKIIDEELQIEDEIEEAVRLYGNSKMLNVVNIDDEMVKSTKVRLRHSAYIRLLNTKIGITKKAIIRLQRKVSAT